MAALLWHGGNRIAGGTLTLGVLVAFVEYLGKFFAPIRDLSTKYTVMQQAMAAAERVFTLLDTERAGRRGRSRRRGGRSRCRPRRGSALERRHASVTVPTGRCSNDVSLTDRRRARRWPSWARPVPASRRSSSCCPAFTTSRRRNPDRRRRHANAGSAGAAAADRGGQPGRLHVRRDAAREPGARSTPELTDAQIMAAARRVGAERVIASGPGRPRRAGARARQ